VAYYKHEDANKGDDDETDTERRGHPKNLPGFRNPPDHQLGRGKEGGGPQDEQPLLAGPPEGGEPEVAREGPFGGPAPH